MDATSTIAAGLLVVLAALVVILTLLPFHPSKRWWVRGAAFPRLQIAVAALVVLAVALLVPGLPPALRLGLALAMAACVAYQLRWILPYSPLAPRRVPAGNSGSRRLRLLVANVEMENEEYPRFLDLVARCRPDLILTLETNRRWQTALAPLDESHPHGLRCPLDNTYGMHLWSRWPLENGGFRYLIEDDIPSIKTDVRLPWGGTLRLYGLHPEPPSPTQSEDSESRDAELLLVGRECARVEGPVIVAGDLNDVAWSRVTRGFVQISGLKDPRLGRGLYNSFHARWPVFRWPMDHVFHSAHFALGHLERLPYFGSDHFPICVELVLRDAVSLSEDLP